MTMNIGARLTATRKAAGMTQEKLAEKLGVTPQAISTWERDENIPDTGNLVVLAKTLNVSLDDLFSDKAPPSWTLQSPNFDPDHMYTYVKAKAQSLQLHQTLAALPFMREKHEGQYRKGKVDVAPYRVHPLTLACHALAMGLEDDDVIAAALLHDVVEDTGTKPEELPVNDRVRHAVQLVSYNTYPHNENDPQDKLRIKPEYYANISRDPLAALVKCLDRCNNLSCMADGFTRERMKSYITETESYIVPLLDVIKAIPAWNNTAWLLRYQIHTLLEIYKRLL